MDGSHYPSNVPIGTSASSYPSPAVAAAAISPHQLQQHNGQLQQNGHLPPHTLPPLQPSSHSPALQNIYASHPHTPRTPTTPNPSGPSTMSSYPQPPSQGGGRGYPQMMGSYPPPPHQGYGTSSSMMPQSSVAASHQPIAPAPAASRPPILRPMPAGGVMPQSGMSSPYGQSPLMPHQQSILQDNDQPTHVVGSQGRRGILPSAPGRPPAPTGGTNGKGTVIPQKDADGKFPCPHCTKTYLHAKHLKRHLLRHTGDRPYMCVLCRDTFSRSDILKRHFQKCSIRRGNPTGASHLSHPQAHVKKHQAAQQKAQEGELNQMNGMNNMQNENVMHHPFGMVQVQADQMSSMANDQNQLSRSSSMSRMDDSNRDRRSMTGGGSVYGNDGQNSMASNINPQLANYGMPQGQNGMPMFAPGPNQGQGQNLDWNSMFPPGAQDQDTYVSSFPPPNLGQTQIATRPEPSSLEAERPMGAPNDVNDRSLFFSNWGNPPTTHENPYYFLSSQILNFFPPGNVGEPQTAGMNAYFSPANIKNFLENYTHFHIHFSVLHIPTFRIMEAYPGLVAAICCIGACYSDRVSPTEVRDAMNLLKSVLERDSNLFSGNGPGESKAEFSGPTGNDTTEMERLLALLLLITLLTWNGTPTQRAGARRQFPQICSIARKLGLLDIRANPSLYSILHQPDLSLNNLNPVEFNWMMWVEQERRVRLMHLLYLTDVAYGLYFNDAPQLDAFEIRIPLPADDAAWDAGNATECAEALHLYGTDAAKARNPDGSQRSKQPELHLALNALLHPSYQIHPGSTNLSGKFVLIHCLIAQIRRAYVEEGWNANGASTPLSHKDWVLKSSSEAGSGNVSANNSGRATPVSGPSPQAYKALSTALEKFKSNWDMDMAIQFPPSVQNPRRYGFSRDGIHFFWLAKYLLKNTRPKDVHLPSDNRLRQMMHLLKSVKSWVMNDGANRGEELGSVGEIDSDYGLDDLTLNMAGLFKPLPHVVDSSTVASVKTKV